MQDQVKDNTKQGMGDIYLKSQSIRNTEDVQRIKDEISRKMILILKITPLAQKSVGDLKKVVEELYEFTTSMGGDIARLGEERVVVTPPGVRIWRGLL
uniref:Cell division protein SepF n=1 Tax=uncultured marine thaumarchaeote KM3_06_C02 TaxID=1455976 RepID=A0A075G503_9ARCH|nr:hypothetical protein [uncultured marine thaumarchaeote KM3_06_C02]